VAKAKTTTAKRGPAKVKTTTVKRAGKTKNTDVEANLRRMLEEEKS
jgi:hypothetical protein